MSPLELFSDELEGLIARAAPGVERDDLLLQVNGRAVTRVDELQRQMALDASPDVELLLWRKGARTSRRIAPAPRAAH